MRDRDYRDKCAGSEEKWKPPAERAAEKNAAILLFGEYGKRVIDQRRLAARTRIEYDAKWSALIEPTFGRVAVSDLNPTAVRAWFSSLDTNMSAGTPTPTAFCP